MNVLTQHNDNRRTGANLSETLLTTASVNARRFGKLFSRSVDGCVYAQPLYVAQVPIPAKGATNVVYVATEHNSVYAFDADDPGQGDPLWRVNLGTPVPSADIDPEYRDLTPEVGITSTPAIDAAAQTMYVVAKSKDESGGVYHQRLHALDLATGQERPGSPVEIAAQVKGTGDGNVDGVISFDPLLNLNRPGLLLLNGVVYLAFGSHGDIGAYHGWILGYDARTLRQTTVFNATPDGGKASIWMSGQGLVADEGGSLYAVTSNGTFDAQNGGRDYGDCALRFSTGNGLTVTDYFSPHNQDVLSAIDADLGAGGPVLPPGANRLLFTGKDRVLRVVDTDSMGGYSPDSDPIVQHFQVSEGWLLGAPVYWNSPGNGPVVYVWGAGDVVKVFRLAGGQLDPMAVEQGAIAGAAGVSNSPPMALSANGSREGTGILWATTPIAGDANEQTVHGVLRAFDASNVANELWDSQQNAARDDLGSFAKFCPPTVANGKVYVATFSGQLQVYGLLPSACAFSLDQSKGIVSAGRGQGSIRLQTDVACDWAASTGESWINLTSASAGSGAGTITYSVDANPDPAMRSGLINIAGQDFTVTQAGAAATASAASFAGPQLAGESIAVAWGANLATETAAASASAPTTLGGASVTLTDSAGVSRLAPLFFASPAQINYLIPDGTAPGDALITVANAAGNIATAELRIDPVAPGLFSAESTGQGLAAAVVCRVKAGGEQTFEPVAQFDPARNAFVPLPIDLGPADDQVYLILFGTGLRNRSSLANVDVRIGELDLQPAFAGAQGALLGVDQINLLLPRRLAGVGDVDVRLTADGVSSNGVHVLVR